MKRRIDERLFPTYFGLHTGRAKALYPDPLTLGRELLDKELGVGAMYLSLNNDRRHNRPYLSRYDLDNEQSVMAIMDGSLGAVEMPNTPSTPSQFKELANLPYYVLWRDVGCDLICTAGAGLQFEGERVYELDVPYTLSFGSSLFDDGEHSGIIVWHGGTYHLLDFSDMSFLELYTGTDLAEAKLFADKVIGKDADDNLYEVAYDGVKPLGIRGKRYAYAAGTIAADDRLYSMDGKILSEENCIPYIGERCGTNNAFFSKGKRRWATSWKRWADHTGNTGDGDERYILWSASEAWLQDYARRANLCADDRRVTLRNIRWNCNSIAYGVYDGTLYSTGNYSGYYSSGISIDAPIYKIFRVKSVKRAGLYSVTLENTGDPYNMPDTVTVKVWTALFKY